MTQDESQSNILLVFTRKALTLNSNEKAVSNVIFVSPICRTIHYTMFLSKYFQLIIVVRKSFQMQCRPVACPKHFILNNGQCELMFKSLKHVYFKLLLRLSHRSLQSFTLSSVLQNISYSVDIFLQRWHGEVVDIEVIQPVSVADEDFRSYKQYNVKLTIKSSGTDTEEFIKVLRQIHNKYVLDNKLFSPLIGNTNADAIRIEIVPQPKLLRSSVVGTNLSTLSDPYIHQDSVLEIDSPLSCPVVSINRKDVSVSVTSDGFMTLDNEFCVNADQYFLDKDYIIICSDVYQDYLKNKSAPSSFVADKIISIVCSSVSITALVVTLSCYSIFPELRRSLPGKNVMALSVSLLLAQILYLVANLGNLRSGSVVCKVAGGLVHFSWLVALFWMNACSFHMFLVLTRTRRLAVGSGTKTHLLYHLYTVVCSGVFVGINILLATQIYGDIGYGETSCYISSQTLLYFTFALPVAAAILSNLVMFTAVVVRIRRSHSIKRNVKNDRNDMAIFAKLSTITGITWFFGFIYLLTNVMVFSYLFILFNASQGLFVCFGFVVNRRVLRMFKEKTSKKGSSAVTSSRTTATDTLTSC